MENEEVDPGLDSEIDDEEIWYADDPVADPKIDWYYKLRSFAPIAIVLLVSTIYLPSTVGGKFSLNSGSSIYEFGQGVAKAFPCSNSNNLTITPNAQFTNASNSTGTHYFKSITFAGIPSSCIGVDFIVSAYDNSDSNPLALYNVDNRIAYVSMDPGPVFSPGLNSKGLTVQTNTPVSGFYSFTLTFDSPVADARQVYKVTVQTSTHQIWSCAIGGTCSVGDLGPGGGTVFYKNVSGFNCGTLDNATGSPSGGLCNYLELAPNGFNTSYSTVLVGSHKRTYHVANSPNVDVGTIQSAEIGAGLKYTNAVIAGNSRPAVCNVISTCTYAPFIPRLYSSNGLADWYLPNISELNQLCKWLYNQTYVSDTTACNTSGSLISGYTWPSTGYAIASNSKATTEFWAMVLYTPGVTCDSTTLGKIVQWYYTQPTFQTCTGFYPMAIRAF